MKKILFLVLIIFPVFLFQVQKVHALDCSSIDGLSVFGYDDDNYKFIGAITSELDIKSIANQLGAGSELSQDSIFNKLGKYGSELNSTSAFNELAVNPPILINKKNEVVGYLTVNESKIPALNPYVALACAKQSWQMHNRDHEDATFTLNHSAGGFSAIDALSQDRINYINSINKLYEQQEADSKKKIADLELLIKQLNESSSTSNQTPSSTSNCPENSYYSSTDNKCNCNTGYAVYQNSCIKHDDACVLTYGSNFKGIVKDNGQLSCDCVTGYIYNTNTKVCNLNSTSQPNIIDKKLSDRVKGKILLQVEDNGEAWYVNPKDSKRYYMANGDEAYNIMRNLSVGINNNNFKKLLANKTFAKTQAGKIFIKTEDLGKAYYVDSNGTSYYLKDGIEAYGIMRKLGLGIKNSDLNKIEISQ